MSERVSNYEIILPLDDAHSLLVNGLYGAFDVVDRSEAEALSAGDSGALAGEERERLLARGHLTDSPETEREDLAIFAGTYRKLFAERNLSLYILPTYDCNFRCPYCFERHRLSCGEEWLKKTMTTEMADAVFEAVKKERRRGVKAEECCLYGGEPLLKENRELVRYIAGKAADAGMKLRAVTNGYDLGHYMDILTEYPFEKLQITLDGVKEDNDKRRVYVGGGGSYEKILENSALALSKGIRVQLRVNVGPQNLDRIHELPQVFAERGLSGQAGFSYYFSPTGGENYPGKDYGVSCGDIVRTLVRHGFDQKDAMRRESHYASFMNVIRGLVEKKEYLFPVDSNCGSERNMLLVDPSGTLFACWDFVAMDHMRVGRVDTEKGKFAYNFELLKWNFRNVLHMPDCMKCPYVFACAGGCASRAYNKTGDPASPYCGETEEMFRETAVTVCGAYYDKTGERELTKSLKELVSGYTPEERKDLLNTRDPETLLSFFNKMQP